MPALALAMGLGAAGPANALESTVNFLGSRMPYVQHALRAILAAGNM